MDDMCTRLFAAQKQNALLEKKQSLKTVPMVVESACPSHVVTLLKLRIIYCTELSLSRFNTSPTLFSRQIFRSRKWGNKRNLL